MKMLLCVFLTLLSPFIINSAPYPLRKLITNTEYFNWSQVIPAWKINIQASSDVLNTNELSYEERYNELIKKQFELQANYDCSLNPFTEIDYMEKYKKEMKQYNNSIEEDVVKMVPTGSHYDFKSFPRWDLGLSYKDFNRIDFTFPYEAVDRMNDWLRDAKHFYSHPNKDVVLKAFDNLEVVSSDVMIDANKNENCLKLASSCEVETLNEISGGALGRILYDIFDDSFLHWNTSLLTLYELKDGWWDCRRQSIRSAAVQKLNQTLIRVSKTLERWENCFPALSCQVNESNLDNILQLPSICVTISMIKGVLQWINHFINEDKTHTIDFAKLQKIKENISGTDDIPSTIEELDILGLRTYENITLGAFPVVNEDDIDLSWKIFDNPMNLTNYTSILNPTSSEPKNDSVIQNFKRFRHNQKMQSENDSSLLSLQCRQLLTDFLPALIDCGNQSSGKELCENEVMNHPTAMKIWKLEFIEIFHELSLETILSFIPQSDENEKTTKSGCKEVERDKNEKDVNELGGNIFLKLVSHAPVDGKWSQWDSWSACSISCQNREHQSGVRIRRRKCDQPLPSNGGYDCVEWISRASRSKHHDDDINVVDICRKEAFEKSLEDDPIIGEDLTMALKASQEENCTINLECPKVDGNWSPWYSWSACSTSCGKGIRHSRRYCNAPKPSKDPAGDECEIKLSHRSMQDILNDEMQYDEKEEECNNDVCEEKVSSELNAGEVPKEVEDKFYDKCSKMIDPRSWTESRYHRCLQFFNDNEGATVESVEEKESVSEDYFDLERMDELYESYEI